MSVEQLLTEAKESLESQNFLKALGLLDQGLEELKPDLAEYQSVRCLRATVLARLDRIEEADDAFSEILRDGFASETVDGTVLASLFSLGEMYRLKGRIAEAKNPLVVAVEMVTRAQLEDELAFRIRYSVAAVLRQVGMWVESLRQAKEAFRIMPPGSPYGPPILSLSAELAIHLQQYQLAADLFAALAVLEKQTPEREAALLSLADMRMVQGKFPEALEALDRMQDEAQGFAALRRRGVCLARLAQFAEAESTLLKARELAPGSLERLELTKQLGDLQARQEHWEQATERYQEASTWARSRSLKAQLRYELGKMSLKLEREEEARVHFARASRLWQRSAHPPRVQNASALQNLASIYNRRNQPKRSANRLYLAMALLDQEPPAEVLHPEQRREMQRTTFAVLEELSISMELQGKHDDAVSALVPVATAAPSPERSTRMSQLYQRAENTERAQYWSDVARQLSGEGKAPAQDPPDDSPPPPRVKLF
jgi:tetratricopeptide (TPR) repeat protein